MEEPTGNPTELFVGIEKVFADALVIVTTAPPSFRTAVYEDVWALIE